MLQHDVPQDFVIATGETPTVLECVEIAFDHAGISPGGRLVIDDSARRPADVDELVGDASKARDALGWTPRTSFEPLIRLMVDADLELLSR